MKLDNMLVVLMIRLGIAICEVAEDSEIKNNILLAYDNTSTFDDNLYVLLSVFCPETLFCSDDIGQRSEWVTSVLNETDVAYEWMFSNKSTDIIEARRKLISSHHMQCCCKVCSCEKNCEERGNCCPLSRLTMKETAKKQQKPKILQVCVHSSIGHYYRSFIPSVDTLYGHSYYMVVDCFTSTSDIQTLQKCQNPDVQFPEQVTPVYSPSTNRIYRNKFCAECNNDDQVISWELQLFLYLPYVMMIQKFDFFSNPMSLYHSIVNRYNTRNADIIFMPPEELQIKEENPLCILPENNPVDQCSSNHLERNESVQFLQHACSSGDYVYTQSKGRYLNFICYACRNNIVSNEFTCTSRIGQRYPAAGFTAILSTGDLNEHDKPVDDRITPGMRCGCGDYFDNKQKSCRELFCPFGDVSSGCSCRAFTKNISGLHVDAYTELTVMEPNHNDFTGESSDAFVKNLPGLVSRYFKSRWQSVYSFVIAIFQENNIPDTNQIKFLTIIRMSVENGYNWRDNMQTILSQLQNGMKIRLRNTQMFLSLGPIYDISIRHGKFILLNNTGTTFGINSTSIFSKPFTSTLRSITLHKLLFCKQIQLNQEEVSRLVDLVKSKGYSASYLTNIYLQEKERLCIDDFIELFTSPSSVASTSRVNNFHVGWLLVIISALHKLYASC